MQRRILSLTLLSLFLTAQLTWADPPHKHKPIDLVLCLDTSNSMDGLIDSEPRVSNS